MAHARIRNSRNIDTHKVGRKDRYPDYVVRDKEDRADTSSSARNDSWRRGDKGQAREGRSKGYGGSEGRGTGPSGPERK